MNIHRQEMKKSQGIFLFSPPFRVSGRQKTGQKSLKLTAKAFYFHLTFCHNRLPFPYNYPNKSLLFKIASATIYSKSLFTYFLSNLNSLYLAHLQPKLHPAPNSEVLKGLI